MTKQTRKARMLEYKGMKEKRAASNELTALKAKLDLY
jgi:hypothetical protein